MTEAAGTGAAPELFDGMTDAVVLLHAAGHLQAAARLGCGSAPSRRQLGLFRLETASPEAQERVRPTFTDRRLPRAERARLGARGSILGSVPVNRLFSQVSGEALRLLMFQNNPDAILGHAAQPPGGEAAVRVPDRAEKLGGLKVHLAPGPMATSGHFS